MACSSVIAFASAQAAEKAASPSASRMARTARSWPAMQHRMERRAQFLAQRLGRSRPVAPPAPPAPGRRPARPCPPAPRPAGPGRRSPARARDPPAGRQPPAYTHPAPAARSPGWPAPRPRPSDSAPAGSAPGLLLQGRRPVVLAPQVGRPAQTDERPGDAPEVPRLAHQGQALLEQCAVARSTSPSASSAQPRFICAQPMPTWLPTSRHSASASSASAAARSYAPRRSSTHARLDRV